MVVRWKHSLLLKMLVCHGVEYKENYSYFNKKISQMCNRLYSIEHTQFDVLKILGVYGTFVIWKLKIEMQTVAKAYFPRFNINIHNGRKVTTLYANCSGS